MSGVAPGVTPFQPDADEAEREAVYELIVAGCAERLQPVTVNDIREAVGAKRSSDDRHRAADGAQRYKPT
jgi:hypothetical protein